MVRIDRKGNIVVINDDPKNHTHKYYDSLQDAVKARYEEFVKLIPEPFTLLLELDKSHNCWNVMTKNPKSTYGKGYRHLYKKRTAVFIRNAEGVTALFNTLGIDYCPKEKIKTT